VRHLDQRPEIVGHHPLHFVACQASPFCGKGQPIQVGEVEDPHAARTAASLHREIEPAPASPVAIVAQLSAHNPSSEAPSGVGDGCQVNGKRLLMAVLSG